MGTAPPGITQTGSVRGALPFVRAALIARHVFLVLALMASAALLIDYRNAGDPAFCGVASGCFAVRISAYSSFLGVPLPNLALPAFAILLGGSLLARTIEHQRLLAGAAGVGGLIAIALILVQKIVIRQFCPWCVIVDSCAILSAAASIGIAVWAGGDEERGRAVSVTGASAAAWGVAGGLAVALPLIWARYPVVVPPPAEIAAEQEAGKVTIVTFTDFECPFCRKLHPVLEALREQHKDRLHVVFKMKPLGGHANALPAAKAWMCAPEEQRDAVADVLYETEPVELTETKLEALADRFDLGGREAFAECMKSAVTELKLIKDADLFDKVQGRGLPLTYVGGRVIMGLNPERLSQSVEAELSGSRPSLPIWAMFAALGAVVVGAAFVSWRR